MGPTGKVRAREQLGSVYWQIYLQNLSCWDGRARIAIRVVAGPTVEVTCVIWVGAKEG